MTAPQKPGRTRVLHQRWQVREIWRAMEALERILPISPPASRKRLYAALESLVLDLVAALEEAGFEQEAPYREAGEFLDHCRRLRDAPVLHGQRMGHALPRPEAPVQLFIRS